MPQLVLLSFFAIAFDFCMLRRPHRNVRQRLPQDLGWVHRRQLQDVAPRVR